MTRSRKNARPWAGVLSALALAAVLAAPSRAQEPTLWFPVGEELIYRLYWSFLPVGKTRVVTEWIEEDGRKLISVKYRTRTNRVVQKIFPVNDYIESVIDPATFLPVRFREKLRRRKVVYDEETVFDYAKGRAQWRSFVDGTAHDIELRPSVRELVSFMYFMRSQPLTAGEVQRHRVLADGKLWDTDVVVHATEDVNLPLYGAVPSIKLEPKNDFRGIFDLHGQVLLWVSDDARRVCTRMQGDAPVGSVKAILCEVFGPGDDRWVELTHGLDRAACAEEYDVENDIRQPVPDPAPEIPPPSVER